MITWILRMSFNLEYNNAINALKPFGRRYLALLHCVEYYAWLTHSSFSERYLNLGLIFDFDFKHKPTLEQIIDSANLLKAHRDYFLIKLSKYENDRILLKHKGIRQPSKIQIKELYFDNWKGKLIYYLM